MRIWQDAAKECFGGYTERNLWLLARCRASWQELRKPEYDLTFAEMTEQERAHLMPMIAPFDGYDETLGKVSSACQSPLPGIARGPARIVWVGGRHPGLSVAD